MPEARSFSVSTFISTRVIVSHAHSHTDCINALDPEAFARASALSPRFCLLTTSCPAGSSAGLFSADMVPVVCGRAAQYFWGGGSLRWLTIRSCGYRSRLVLKSSYYLARVRGSQALVLFAARSRTWSVHSRTGDTAPCACRNAPLLISPVIPSRCHPLSHCRRYFSRIAPTRIHLKQLPPACPLVTTSTASPRY